MRLNQIRSTASLRRRIANWMICWALWMRLRMVSTRLMRPRTVWCSWRMARVPARDRNSRRMCSSSLLAWSRTRSSSLSCRSSWLTALSRATSSRRPSRTCRSSWLRRRSSSRHFVRSWIARISTLLLLMRRSTTWTPRQATLPRKAVRRLRWSMLRISSSTQHGMYSVPRRSWRTSTSWRMARWWPVTSIRATLQR